MVGSVLAALIFSSFFIPSTLWARGPGWVLSMPGFQDDGDTREPFKIVVGTAFPVQLYSPDLLKDRAVLIYNPSSSYDLMLGTSSNFNVTDLYWTVPQDSGVFITSNHQALWAKYEDGASSETVRGVVEKQ